MKREQNDKEVERVYACDICAKIFKNFSDFINCKRKHEEKSDQIKQNVRMNEISKYSCNICRENFMLSDDLSKHVKCKRKKEKCEIIKQNSLAFSSNLFSSDICNERFIQNDDQVEHKNIHTEQNNPKSFQTDIKPLSGDLCEDSFTQYNVLTNLQMNHSVFGNDNNQIQEKEKETNTNNSCVEIDHLETDGVKEELDDNIDIEYDPLLVSFSNEEVIYCS